MPTSADEPAPPRTLPAMLFPADEVLLPGSTQVLHLYEARFLALLDEISARTGGLFAHLTFQPPAPGAPPDDGLRVNQVATLVRVEDVRRSEVGAKVTIVGESRVALVDVLDADPYVRAAFVAVPTMGAEGTAAYVPSEAECQEVEALTEFISAAVEDVATLVDRLMKRTDDADPEALWDISDAADDVEWGHAEVGNLRRAMAWVEAPSVGLDDLPAEETVELAMEDAEWYAAANAAASTEATTREGGGFEGDEECDEESAKTSSAASARRPSVRAPRAEGTPHTALQLAERLSFACLQVAPASTAADLRRLASCREAAMSTSRGLMDRLKLGQIVLDEQRQALRAKLALEAAFGEGEGGGEGGGA